MKCSILNKASEKPSANTLLAVALGEQDAEGPKLGSRVQALDKAIGGAIEAAVRAGAFLGRAGDKRIVHSHEKKPRNVLLLGLGKEPSTASVRNASAQAVRTAASKQLRDLELWLPALKRAEQAGLIQAVGEGCVLGSYRFDGYRQKKDDAPGDLRAVDVAVERLSNSRSARTALDAGVAIAEGQNRARALSNEPPNEMYPASLASAAQKTARECGLKCKVLDVPAMKKLGMGAILAVGQGSSRPPRMIVLEHNAPKRGERKRPTVCVVGKGVTFDSGGISIKPSPGMDDMKHDMHGAATVVGVMHAVAKLGLKLHVVGVIGAAENLPSGTAYRPGDIVTTMSGKTIEILNTDAEGRVVLADALHYAAETFSPRAMVDLATLTGAMVISLGPWATGVFTTNDALADDLLEAGETTGERFWRMPLWDEHRKHMVSQVADLKNAAGRDAGSSTAAGFLAAFVDDALPWAHLDIAGTAWTSKSTATQPHGATGVGVRSLVEWLRHFKVPKA